MAATGLPSVKKWRMKSTAFGSDPQLIRVGNATRQQQRVELLRPGLVQRDVNRELLSLVEVLPALHLTLRG